MLAGYLRVSHVGGRKVLHSPADQAQEIEAWAKAHGHEVTMLTPELDAKGDNPDRPIFREAISGVRSGWFRGVVVAYLSRAGRDLRLMLDLWDEIEAAGGKVYSARENIDASTPAGRLHRNLLASIAQHELEERREGFERARRGAVERGIWQRRQTPRGYVRDPETRRLVVDDAESIREAARALLSGAPVIQIADRLGMTGSGVRQMLRNRVYLGELRVGRHVNPDAHPAILDPETFAAVTARLDSRVRPGSGGRAPALLAGLVRCASCGHVMTRTSEHETFAYQCPTRHSEARCPRPTAIRCAGLDEHVTAIALRELDRLRARASKGDRLSEVRGEVGKAERELAAYLEAVDVAGIGSDDAAAGMRRRREALDHARAALDAELSRAPMLPAVTTGRQWWTALSEAERNHLLRGLLCAVVVRPVGRGRKVVVTERARVLRHGADVRLPVRRAGESGGIVPLWPDADGVDVLGVAGVEDRLQGASGVA